MLLAILSSVGGVASLLFLLVPVGRVNVIFPNKAEVTVGCFSEGFNIDISQFPCEPLHPYGYDVEMRLKIQNIIQNLTKLSVLNQKFISNIENA